MKITVEFSGGCELLFDNQTKINLDVKEGLKIKDLITLLRNEHLKEKPELFINNEGTSIRPGILILINDTDWELLDELEYVIQEKDNIVFISTLHGG
ncbi:hypothetical protein ABK040_013945 [Willaertia magna]